MYNAPSPYTASSVANTSGQGSGSPVPPEIQGWNWGAFLLSWIWGLGNSVMIALLALIIPFWSIYLGIKGNELAWQNKRWDSVEHFKQVQSKWTRWGLIVVGGLIALSCVCTLLSIMLTAATGSSR